MEELDHEIEKSFGTGARAADIPEIVIIDSDKQGIDYSGAQRNPDGLGAQYLKRGLRPFDVVTSGIERLHNRLMHGESAYLFPYDELINPIEGSELLPAVDEKVFSPVYNETIRRKRRITKEMLIDCGFARFYLDENNDMETVLNNIWAYMNDRNDAHIKDLVTEERLRASYEAMCTFDIDVADDDYDSLKLIGKMDNDGQRGFKDWADYKRYQRTIATSAKKLNFDEIKEQMKKRYITLLKEGIERIADVILRDHDNLMREHRLIRPVVISTSRDLTFQRYAIEHGANMIPESLSEADIERVVILAERMKLSEASLAREKTQRTKRHFYRKHEADLSSRSELTADTEQELQIIKNTLETARANNVLDIGCGEGRIAGPLAESGYTVTGLEANEAFRQKAQEKIGEHGTVIKGDVIDYRREVPAEQYDAVTYTWHTVLEAYGIGNTMQTLVSAWRALKPGGILIFDQPTRENNGMEDGWYGDKEGREYLAYLMSEDELNFTLRMAGFNPPEIHAWTTKPTALYPEGMKKITVIARKPMFDIHNELIAEKEKAPSEN